MTYHGLGRGDGKRFYTVERVHCIVDHGPESEKFAPATIGDVRNKWSRVVPVLEAHPRLSRYSTKIDAQTHDDDTDNEENLKNREEELDFSVHADKHDSYHESDDKEDRDPDCRIEIGPVLHEYNRCCNLGWHTEEGSVYDVPADRKAKSWIHKDLCMTDKSSSLREQC